MSQAVAALLDAVTRQLDGGIVRLHPQRPSIRD